DTGELGDNVTGETTPTLTGTGTPGETVTLYADDAPVGTAIVDDAGNYSVTPDAPLAEGTPALTVTTTDPSGNESSPSAPLMLTIDETASTAPAAPTLDSASDTGAPGDNITGDTTPTLTGTGTPSETIKLYADGEVVGSTVVDLEGNYSVTPDAPLSEGTPALIVTTTDESGNESAPSAPLTLTIDETAPTSPVVPTLDPASDTGELGDNTTGDTTPTLTGTGTPGETVTLYADGTEVGTAVVDDAGNYSVTPDVPLAEGTPALTVTTTDESGNESAPSEPLMLTVDETSSAVPVAPTLAPASDTGAPNDNITSDTTPTLTGTGTPGETVKLYADGLEVGTTVVDDAGNYSVTPDAPLAEGTPALTVTTTDESGNESATSPALPVVIDATVPDSISIDGTIAVDNVVDSTEQQNVVISGQNGESGNTVEVTFTDGTTTLGPINTEVQLDGSWAIPDTDIGGLTNGDITVSVTETDLAGNVSTPVTTIFEKNVVESGSGGGDTITGGAGTDIINGLSDDDILDGGAGDDVINGGSDQDIILGGTGNDILNGGSKDDQIDAGDGDDLVNGGSGNDILNGQNGRDLLSGGSGSDLIYGGDGDDLLTGGSNDDILYGEAGQDLLRGSSGNDVLIGGTGDDLLFGGQGRDAFTYTRIDEFGDTIYDFEIVRDRIDLSGIFNGNASLGSNVIAQQNRNHTAILADTGSGMEQVALLLNVNADTLDNSNFIF
ncbi:MAG: Ig-like domain-containing protein, partial [Phormidesmis sp.]